MDGVDGLVISIQGLRQRLRLVIHEGFRFLIVGGIGAVLTIGGAVAMHSLGKYVAITIATIAATIFTFVGNRYWTFTHRQGQGATHESLMFFLLNGVGLLIYYGCIWVIQDLMRLESRFWYMAALVIGTGLGTLFRFWSYRKWVWTHHPQYPPRVGGTEFPGYVEAAFAGSAPVHPIRVLSSALTSRPPGRAAARHAAPRRVLERPVAARSQPGAHRRT